MNDGSRTYHDGLYGLERILRMLRPDTTALLPNYPNPFNPETWIPFDLAEAGVVHVTIYDLAGRVVRSLRLGHVEQGMHRRSDSAAYWDGLNSTGEHAGSGIYIYELRAGDYREARRMVIQK
jgi:hypothetical protein